MNEYQKISKKIDSIEDWDEQCKYCKKVLAQIHAEWDMEYKLADEDRLLEAIRNGEIPDIVEIGDDRLEVYEKCNKIIEEHTFLRAVGKGF